MVSIGILSHNNDRTLCQYERNPNIAETFKQLTVPFRGTAAGRHAKNPWQLHVRVSSRDHLHVEVPCRIKVGALAYELKWHVHNSLCILILLRLR